jgi:hypothetical protein
MIAGLLQPGGSMIEGDGEDVLNYCAAQCAMQGGSYTLNQLHNLSTNRIY